MPLFEIILEGEIDCPGRSKIGVRPTPSQKIGVRDGCGFSYPQAGNGKSLLCLVQAVHLWLHLTCGLRRSSDRIATRQASVRNLTRRAKVGKTDEPQAASRGNAKVGKLRHVQATVRFGLLRR
jgi:hypothetical protein